MMNALFTYRLPLATSNASYTTHAQVTVTLAAEVALVTLGDPSLHYDAPSHSVRWNGSRWPAPRLPGTVQRKQA